jgi:ketosteroid isomerase-like protein
MPISVRFLAALILCSPASIAVVEAQNQSPSPPRPARVTLMLAERELASNIYRLGYAKGIASALDDGVAFLYEGAPVIVGRENVRRLLEAQSSLAGMRIVAQPITGIVSADGTFGITYGATIVTAQTHPRDSLPRRASYITVWRRPAGGTWKVIARVDADLVDPATVVLPDAIRALPVVRGALMNRPILDFAQADAAFSRAAGRGGAPAAFEQFAAPDGATFGAGGAINLGPPAIRASLQAGPAANAAWSWVPVYGASSSGGDLAYTMGEATIRPPNASAASAYHGKYLTVWRRQADGTVKYLIDGGNSRPPPAP